MMLEFVPPTTRPRLLKDYREILGILESVEPYCRGLVLAKIGEYQRILPEELQLHQYVGKSIGVANIEGEHLVRILGGI